MSPPQWAVWSEVQPHPLRFRARSGYLGGRFQWTGPNMTNTIAVVLALILIAAISIDVALYGSEHMVFLGKRLFELIDWIAFWR
jgi:hypothetical protein